MPHQPVHSYDHGEDPTELGRLSMQADIAWSMERAELLKQGLRPTDRVLDVGCGPGHLSCRMASLVPGGTVMGVDTDPTLLEQARSAAREQGLSNVDFAQSRAEGMPLADGSADFAYARFVLQHVSQPVDVLREMARVVVPGGKVMIVDTDDGSIMVHPQPEGLAQLLEASREGQARNGGDRHVGRKLSAHLTAAGLENVQTTVVPFTSHMIGNAMWMQICLGFKTRVVGEQRMTLEAVERVLHNVQTALNTPGAYAHTMVYVTVGTVPQPAA